MLPVLASGLAELMDRTHSLTDRRSRPWSGSAAPRGVRIAALVRRGARCCPGLSIARGLSRNGPETTEDPGYGEDTDEQDQPEVTFLVPQKYNSPRQSGLKVTVQEGDNNIPIELTSK